MASRKPARSHRLNPPIAGGNPFIMPQGLIKNDCILLPIAPGPVFPCTPAEEQGVSEDGDCQDEGGVPKVRGFPARSE